MSVDDADDVGTASAARRRAGRRRREPSAADAWRGLRRDRLAMVGLIVLIVFTVMALIAPCVSDRADFSAINTGDNPTWAAAQLASSCSAPTTSVAAWRCR